MMPVICIYHKDCTDGFGAAYAVYQAFKGLPIKPEFYAGVYNNAPPNVAGKHVIMVDFSYSKATLEVMLAQGTKITIIDHHKSAIKDLADLEHPNLIKVFNMETSGAIATWDYYHREAAPDLLQHVQDRDLWKFSIKGTKEIVASLYSYPFDFVRWEGFISDWNYWRDILHAEGIAILRQQQKQIEGIVEKPRFMHIAGYTVPVVNCSRDLASDVSGILAKGQPFGASYRDEAVYRVFSLRSTKGVGMDVSEIAAQFIDLEGECGGGHHHAAGFRVALKDLRDKYRALL